MEHTAELLGFGVASTAIVLLCTGNGGRRRKLPRHASLSPCARRRVVPKLLLLGAALCLCLRYAAVLGAADGWRRQALELCSEFAPDAAAAAVPSRIYQSCATPSAPEDAWSRQYEAQFGVDALKWNTNEVGGTPAHTKLIAQCEAQGSSACAAAAHPAGADRGFLYFEGPVDGFNAHLLHVVAMANVAATLNRRLVLPVFWEERQLERDGSGAAATGPFPFRDYFDVDALAAQLGRRVITPEDFACRCARTLDLHVETLAPPRRRAKHVAGAAQRWTRDFFKPLSAAQRCAGVGAAAGAGTPSADASTAALLAQRGADGHLVYPCVGLANADAAALTAIDLEGGVRVERLLAAQARGARRTESFLHPDALRIFAALRGARAVRDITTALFDAHALPSPLLALHVRRGDYAELRQRVRGRAHYDCAPLCVQSNAQVVTTVKRLRSVLGAGVPLSVFVASNARDQDAVVDALQPRCAGDGSAGGGTTAAGALPCVGGEQPRRVFSLATVRAALPSGTLATQLAALRPGLRSRVEQEVCARADAFVGNSLSTWSYVVLAMRDAQVFAPVAGEDERDRGAAHARILLFGQRELAL